MVSSTAKMLAAHAGHVTAAKAADVASAEATDVPPTKTAASTALAKTIITRPLMTFSFLESAGLSATGSRQTVARAKGRGRRRDKPEVGCLVVRSIKFRFNRRRLISGLKLYDCRLTEEPARKPALLDPGELTTPARPCFRHRRR
jgi:hypothetical protein